MLLREQKKQIKQLIAKSETGKAIVFLSEIFKSINPIEENIDSSINELICISAKYNDFVGRDLSGQFYENERSVTLNRINSSLLSLLDRPKNLNLADKCLKDKYVLVLEEKINFLKKLNEKDEANNKLLEDIQFLEQKIQQKKEHIETIIEHYKNINLKSVSDVFQDSLQLFFQGKVEDALEILDEESLSLEEEKLAATRILKANILELKGDLINAEKNLLKAVRIFPSCLNHLSIAQYYTRHYQFKAAKISFQESLQRAKNIYEKTIIFNSIGIFFIKRNDHFSALKFFTAIESLFYASSNDEKAVLLYPYAVILLNASTALINCGHLKKAEEYCKTAQRLLNFLHKIDFFQFTDNFLDKNQNIHIFSEKSMQIEGKKTLGSICDNLGQIKANLGKSQEAKIAYCKAITIRRAILNPSKKDEFSVDLVISLNNLSSFHIEREEYLEAEKLLEEALPLIRQLTLQNQSAYLSTLGVVIQNRSKVHFRLKELGVAKKLAKESLHIFRKLSVTHTNIHLPKLASSLNNLAIICQHKPVIAKALLLEALGIWKKLTEKNKLNYLLNIANTLSNLIIIYHKLSKWKKIAKIAKKAIKIHTHLIKQNRYLYLSAYADTLHNIAMAQNNLDQRDNTEQNLLKALSYRAELKKMDYKRYISEDVKTKIQLSHFYLMQSNHSKSLELAKEVCIDIFVVPGMEDCQIHINSLNFILNELGFSCYSMNELHTFFDSYCSKEQWKECLEIAYNKK